MLKQRENEFDFVDWIECIFMKWKWIACMALICAALAGMISIFFVSPAFTATATLYALDAPERELNYADIQLGYALAREYQKTMELQDVHEGVIRQLSLPYTCEEMQEMLNVTCIKNTCMLEISVTASQPDEAAEIANAYASVGGDYIEKALGMNRPRLISAARVPLEPDGPATVWFCLGGAAVGVIMACIGLAVRMRLKERQG